MSDELPVETQKANSRLFVWLGYFWICLIAGALLFYSWVIFQKSRHTEYPFACDSFGYLMMAKDFRNARHTVSWPRFFINDKKTEELIQLMEGLKIPVEDWDETVASQAYHFFPISGKVGPQYPPGTGIALSLFKEGNAVHGVDQVTCAVILLLSLGALAFAACRKAWIASGMIGIVGYWILDTIRMLGDASYSIDAILLPLTLCLVLLFVKNAVADGENSENKPFKKYSSWLALIAGCLFGFSILVRIPAVFLWPGVFFLSWDRNSSLPVWRKILSPFNVGVFLAGILPLAIYQQSVSGAWYHSTYSRGDNSTPNPADLWSNLKFYSARGTDGRRDWLVVEMLLGAIGLWKIRKAWSPSGASLREFGWGFGAAFLIWLVPIVYFLSHHVQIGYYLMPGTLAAAVVVALTALRFERAFAMRAVRNTRMGIFYLALAFLPGIQVFHHFWIIRDEWRVASTPHKEPLRLPAEMKEPSAWIWADMTSGTIWYYEGKAAFKLPFAHPPLRARIYRVLAERHEPQFFVLDSDAMKNLVKEGEKEGLKFEERGLIAGTPYSYYRLDYVPGN